MWVYLGEEFTHQLLADFDESGKLEARYNTSNVRILQDDENKLFTRVGGAYRMGIMMRSEARSKVGLQVKREDEVYFVEPKKEAKSKDEKDKTDES